MVIVVSFYASKSDVWSDDAYTIATDRIVSGLLKTIPAYTKLPNLLLWMRDVGQCRILKSNIKSDMYGSM